MAKNSLFAWQRGAHQFPPGTTFEEQLSSRGLEGVRWGKPTPMGGEGPNLSAADFDGMARFLTERREAFFVFPDSTIFYGLAQQPSIGPLLFAYRDYLYGTSDIARLDEQFLSDFRKYGVRWVVLETEGSPARLSLWKDFPGLRKSIEQDFEPYTKFGPYAVLKRKQP